MIDNDETKHKSLWKRDIAGMENPDVEGTCTHSSVTTLFVEVRLHIGVRKIYCIQLCNINSHRAMLILFLPVSHDHAGGVSGEPGHTADRLYYQPSKYHRRV